MTSSHRLPHATEELEEVGWPESKAETNTPGLSNVHLPNRGRNDGQVPSDTHWEQYKCASIRLGRQLA
jgi:hypothetical protein